MRISINPIIIETEDGEVTCSEAEISVAVSDSVAIRLVPTDKQNVQYPEQAIGLVGTNDSEDTVTLLAAVRDAVQTFATGRGV